MDSTDEVIIERRGAAGIVRLNRPKALNSLTLPMVRTIASALRDFAVDPAVASVIVSGEGERGLCAGGDIRLLHQSGKDGSGKAETFWREEFLLNHAISRYPKPYVVLMDGITMGGGVGLSAHGSHRVVTERTRLAMPETGIGYFPDVGATWLLPRAPGEAGTWMGLSGVAIGAADAIHAGFADHCVSSSALPDLIDAVAALPVSISAADIHALIETMATDAGESRLAANRDMIDRAFAGETVEDILQALADETGEFAAETAGVIAGRSPTSLKLTLRLLRAGRVSADLAECLDRELGACMGILHNHDFYEGVRAAVIDKDRNPKWSPASLSDVTAADIDRFFVAAQPLLFGS
ncbi:enoyl-CoA hydratase/isomerase family protein [Rhizobium sp. P38BS-XIX]|uniref:enoyl-CoA hydratase/isomerase family protein n=1 Tax=Rhizobium sp. P38BS-XIX TaxID=2726740 RepID=UPI001456DE28|nr:enoyl-CoA hydratase/isomerase family protein [Rhizobium sp. P38BS-XIX]NLR98928.1 enoyl-CoA hydratase/isomerase family protein [Rhizobium sp. P38BS-XIX]